MSIILDGSTGITTPNIISPTQTISTKLDLTGGQIKFPATQVASSDANTLDDYEEGTWTPGLGLTSSTVGSWTTISGTYTKIGNIVLVTIQVSGTGVGFNSTTGYIQFTGLPFTVGSTSSSSYVTASISGAICGFVECEGISLWIYAPNNTGTTNLIFASCAYRI